MIFSETNQKISAALAKSWAELENPKHNKTVKVKTKTGGSYTFDYTDLSGILDEVKPIFKVNGLTVIQNAYTEVIEGNLMLSVESMLLHTSGEWVKTYPLRAPSNQNMQDIGGQVTYMKRYSISALLGLSTEADDDANGVSGNSFKMSDKKASPKQLDFIDKLIKGKETKEFTWVALYDGLKKRMNTDVEMENWTSQQASQAIKILQGDGNAKSGS